MTILIKMLTIKNDPDGDVFNPKRKTNGFLIVFIDLGWSTFKDDQLEEKNYNNDFQSEGKNQWFFDGFAMTMKLHDFITDCSISIRREISNVFSMIFVRTTRFASIPVFNPNGNSNGFSTISCFQEGSRDEK